MRNVYSLKQRAEKTMTMMYRVQRQYSKSASTPAWLVSTYCFNLNVARITFYNIITEIDRQLLYPAFYYAHTSGMPVSLTAWLCVKIYTSAEHDLCPTCYERPPVLSDRFWWAERVVAQDRFYCTLDSFIHIGLITIRAKWFRYQILICVLSKVKRTSACNVSLAWIMLNNCKYYR